MRYYFFFFSVSSLQVLQQLLSVRVLPLLQLLGNYTLWKKTPLSTNSNYIQYVIQVIMAIINTKHFFSIYSRAAYTAVFVFRENEKKGWEVSAKVEISHVCHYVRLFDSAYIQHTMTCGLYVFVFVSVCMRQGSQPQLEASSSRVCWWFSQPTEWLPDRDRENLSGRGPCG